MAISKQLLPIYDKPMVYYPLVTLMLAGIRQIILISTPRHMPLFQELLGDGTRWGLDLVYAVQDRPRGIADALLISEEFVDNDPVSLILGDNLFFGHGLTRILEEAVADVERATVFAYTVKDPERYGIVEFDDNGHPTRIVEKPQNSRSHWALTGLYLYPSGASSVARRCQPSSRGELEISDVNSWYLERGCLVVRQLHRGFAWLDTGTTEALHQASSFVQSVQARQGLLVSSPDEVAWRLGYIDEQGLRAIVRDLGDTEYGRYLSDLLNTGGLTPIGLEAADDGA
jgi:glucose-1-phosphate thymidylyltransferase